MKKTFFDINSVGKIFLWAVAGPQILGILFELVLLIIAPIFGQTAKELLGVSPVQIAFAMVGQVVFLVIFFVLIKKYDAKKALKIHSNLGIKNIVICVLIGVVGVFSLAPIVDIFNGFLESVGYKISTIGFEVTSPFGLVLAILLLALVPAILEEVIFRGAILQGLKKYGKWVAILGTSGLFVLLHGSLQQVIYPFVLSVVLCKVVLKTDNMLLATIVHFVSNTTTLLIGYFGLVFALPLWASALLAVGGVLLMLILTKLLDLTTQPKKAQEVLDMLPEGSQRLERDNAHFLRMAIGLGVILYALSIWVGFMPIAT